MKTHEISDGNTARPSGMIRVIGSNTMITCPHCGTLIGTVVKDIHAGDMLRMEAIHFFGGNYRVGSRTVCYICAADWYMNGRLHTEEGWR